MTTAPVYKAAIVGLGFVGGGDDESGAQIGQDVRHLDGTHREALSRHPRVQLVAGCDLDSGRRERFADRTGAQTFAEWRDLLDADRYDIVSIATSPPLHLELTLACAERGVRVVYCEKPIAVSVAEADRMLAACESAGTLLVINHNRRFHPNYRRLRELIQSGGLGELTSISLQWPTGRFGCVGTHFFDAMQMVTGQRVTEVLGVLDSAGKPDCRGPQFRDPGGWALLKLDGGLMATVDAADYARTPGTVTFNGTTGRAITGGGQVEVLYWDGRSDRWLVPQGHSSMDQAVDEIVQWLDGGTFHGTAAEAVSALEIVAALHVSHARGSAWVQLPLEGDDRSYEVHAG